jgi:hypothetical protein
MARNVLIVRDGGMFFKNVVLDELGSRGRSVVEVVGRDEAMRIVEGGEIVRRTGQMCWDENIPCCWSVSVV